MVAWIAGASMGLTVGAIVSWHFHEPARARARAHREALALLHDITGHADMRVFGRLPIAHVRKARHLIAEWGMVK